MERERWVAQVGEDRHDPCSVSLELSEKEGGEK